MLRNRKILVTGVSSQVGVPVARALAEQNEVYGLARFRRPEDRERIEALGVTCVAADLADGDLGAVPDDVDHVLHFAVVKSGDFDYDMRANAEGVGRLMSRCRKARSVLVCSSGAVYEGRGHTPVKETDALGDNHRVMFPTYSLSKIAAEEVARFAAREFDLPTTIARFSVPYGDNGGWPWFHLLMMKAGTPIAVHPDQPNLYNLIHEDDYIAQIPKLLEIASVPASVINWAGSESTSVEDWCAWLGELTGLAPKFELSEQTFGSLPLDVTQMNERVGRTRVDWREGLRRMVRARNPELLRER